MEYFIRYEELSNEILKDIKKKFVNTYKVDLDIINLKYYLAMREETSELKVASRMKVSVNKKIDKVTINTPDENFNEYIDFFIKYERSSTDFDNAYNNFLKTFSLQREKYMELYHIEIDDILDEIEEQLLCNDDIKKMDEQNYENTILDILENVYDIKLDETKIMFQKVVSCNKDKKNIEDEFFSKFELSLIDLYSEYRDIRTGKNIEIRTIKGSTTKKQLRLSEYLKNVHKKANENNIRDIYNYYWDSLSSNNIKIDYTSENNYIVGHRRDIIKNDRTPIKLMYSRNEGEVIPIEFKDPINQDEMPDNLISQLKNFDTKLHQGGIIENIKQELNSLSMFTNKNLKVGILLDLYWNLRLTEDSMISLKILLNENNAPLIVDIENKVATLNGKDIESFHDHTYEKDYEAMILNVENGRLLLPFIPNINFNYGKDDMVTTTVTLPKSLAEVYINLTYNSEIQRFFSKKSESNDKRRRYEDLLSVYCNIWPSANCSTDYYYLEYITGINLSLKIYDYTSAMAYKIKNNEKKKETYDFLVGKIITLLFKVKNVYLRLRLVDLVLLPLSNFCKYDIEEDLTWLVAAIKILKEHIEYLNGNFEIAYDAMFYYFGKKIVSLNNIKELLKEIQNMINRDYADYLRIGPKNIHEDINTCIPGYGNSSKEWNKLNDKDRNVQRKWHEFIINEIMEKNKFKQ